MAFTVHWSYDVAFRYGNVVLVHVEAELRLLRRYPCFQQVGGRVAGIYDGRIDSLRLCRAMLLVSIPPGAPLVSAYQAIF